MTLVYGQIESLKKIRQVLNQNGITLFNSISEINKFLSNYESIILEIHQLTEIGLNDEIENLQKELNAYQRQHKTTKINISHKLNAQIASLNKKIEFLKSNNPDFFLTRMFNKIRLETMVSKRYNLKRDFTLLIEKRSYFIKKKIIKTSNKIVELTQNREKIISMRSQTAISKINNTKKILTNLNPLIAGALGEKLVVKELKKLPDDCILINDFSVKCNPPIYNRNDNDRIFSIQIDHLLLTKAGIFVIETKNWSKQSIESFDLKSPVAQIRRTSYAIFVILNNNNSTTNKILMQHHWGDKRIPIRSVIAMINHKPKEKFKYVAIKKLKELNGYVKHFEPIFDDGEVNSIAEHLKRMKSKGFS